MSYSQFHSMVGVGLRSPHSQFFLNQTPQISWLEIHSENYFQPYSAAREDLRQLRQDYQISCHGIGLSLGSAGGVNIQHVDRLRHLVNEVEPMFVSDHLSWSEHQGVYMNDLLPLPYTEEALNIFCNNVLQVQDALKRPLLIENPSSYVSFNHSTLSEWEFLTEMQKRTECRLLLDLNNIHVSAFNHGFDAYQYLRAIPSDAVEEIHLAGFTVKELDGGTVWIDTHSRPVSDEVWQLFAFFCQHYGLRHTLIEWDQDIPEPEVLLNEADKASTLLQQWEINERSS
ncbi:DUF692 domain-containing protein [Vibrio caribbeanicus]|uniref:Uncharacterized protein n=1 Tax=Vibrio caribbeanicus ATCC BAA-2122 TaxID=796620 RepID=E3BF01_9VIBR|nr:DUF692 domain-containing protein [Vibrio caribbeanicus]EFP98364.1 hypothetical protein VIBC2010_05549 [Vibrio caribbeanicus ATCC BAA-2122]